MQPFDLTYSQDHHLVLSYLVDRSGDRVAVEGTGGNTVTEAWEALYTSNGCDMSVSS